MIMAFIDQMRDEGHAVESTCRALTGLGCKVAARTYRSWKATTTVSDQEWELIMVAHQIWNEAHVFDEATRTWRLAPAGLYGRRKMTKHLARKGVHVSYDRVHRAMKLLNHNGITRRRKIRTTVADPAGRRAQDLLERQFAAAAPNLVWVTDFTYVRAWDPVFVYTSFIVDCYAQRIVAWHCSTTKTTDLVMTPLRMALWQRDREGHPVNRGELIHHSDAGSQYTSIRLTEHLAVQEIAPSIGSVGDAYDNALMESIIGLYKAECIGTQVFHQGPLRTLADVEFATAGWVDWYNNDRLHSSNEYVPPVEHENTHYAALTPEVSHS